jgi:hypothetical protein
MKSGRGAVENNRAGHVLAKLVPLQVPELFASVSASAPIFSAPTMGRASGARETTRILRNQNSNVPLLFLEEQQWDIAVVWWARPTGWARQNGGGGKAAGGANGLGAAGLGAAKVGRGEPARGGEVAGGGEGLGAANGLGHERAGGGEAAGLRGGEVVGARRGWGGEVAGSATRAERLARLTNINFSWRQDPIFLCG